MFAEDWPRWRGQEGNGISTEKGWKDQWPASGPKALWRAKVGLGYSAITVAGGKAYTLGHAGKQDTIYGFDAQTGTVVWKHSYAAELGDKYYQGGTSSTPTIQAGRVYVMSRWGDVFCLDAATGKVVWTKNIHQELGIRIPTWGFAGSPVAHDELLILNAGDAGLALNLKDGTVAWKSANKEAGYSTPVRVMRKRMWEVVIGSEGSYVGVDARTGREVWRTKWATQYGVNASDAILSGDEVFLSTGYGKGAALFKIGNAEPVWKSKVLGTKMNGSVLVDGHVYGVDGSEGDDGPLKCVEMATGKEKWAHKGVGTGGLMVADGKFIVLTESGELMTAPVSSRQFSPTSRAQVLGGSSWTAPALANGLIYCRNSRGDVVCLDVR